MKFLSKSYGRPSKLLILGIALFIVCPEVGCSRKLSKTPPPYLAEQIQKRPPLSRNLTSYPIEGPFGCKVTSLAARGNTIVASTPKGVIYRFDPNNKQWKPTKITELMGGINAIIAVDNLFFAGTNTGILKSIDDGFSWHRVHATTAVTGFVVFRETVLAITPSAILRNDLKTESWTPIQTMYNSSSSAGRFPRDSPIRFLVSLEDEVFVSNGHRILASEDLTSWQESDLGLGLSDRADTAHLSLHSLVAIKNKLFAITRLADNPTRLYVRNNSEFIWRPVSVGDVNFAYAFGGADDLFLLSFDQLLKLQNDQFQHYQLPVFGPYVYDLTVVGNSIVIATDTGVYVKPGDSADWAEMSTGLIAAFPGVLAANGRNAVTIRDNKVFKSTDQGKTWNRLWVQSARPAARAGVEFKDAVLVEDLIFLATNSGLYSGKVSDDVLSEVAFTSAMGKGSTRSPNVEQIEVDEKKNVYAVIRNPDKDMETKLFRSDDLGQTWRPTAGLTDLNLAPISVLETVKAIGGTVFLSYSAMETVDVFRLNSGSDNWEQISDGLRQSEVTAFTSAGSVTYAAASDPASTGVKFSPQLFKLEPTETGSRWQSIEAVGLTGQVNALWSDPQDSDIIIAAGDDGLFWSRDAGEHFNRASTEAEATFGKVTAVAEVEEVLFINTDAGIFYVHDQIPRGKWYTAWLALAGEYKASVIASGFGLFLLFVLSTRLISLLLQLDFWGLKKAAPLFYLTAPGRFKLYRRYRASLQRDPDLRYTHDHYVDLPYEADLQSPDSRSDTDRPPRILSDLLTQQQGSSRVVVIADGGNGKTALCSYVAYQCVTRHDIFGHKRLQPVVIDGLTYTGDLLNTITNTLKENRAYVNETIVSSQLAAGNLLIIFDGFTEIRESYLPAASSADLPGFIRQHPDTPFIFTSRSELPAPVRHALGNVTLIRLTTVDEPKKVVTFLSKYLKRGEQEVDALMKEIDLKFKALPRIPLLLKLVATLYDRKGRVPKDTAALFAEYAEYVLRPEATGIDEPIGLNYALRHLVRESYLRSGGDRGLTVDRGVELLIEVENKLAAYDIRIAPIRLLRVLTRAGLYKQVGINLRFFHDSFESYFAALALESDFHDRRYDFIKSCVGNERLVETWQFLSEMLERPDEMQKLLELQQDAETDITYL